MERSSGQAAAGAPKVRKVKHHPALPYAEIGDFISKLRKVEGVSARALEFIILTATRTGETVGARWGEIDLERRTFKLVHTLRP